MCASLVPASASAQAAPSVTLTLEACVGADPAAFDAALELELRGVEFEARAWASAAGVSATLSCTSDRITLQLHAHGDACGAPARLGDDARLGVGFPRLAALAVVELLEACRDLSVDTAPPEVVRDGEPPSAPLVEPDVTPVADAQRELDPEPVRALPDTSPPPTDPEPEQADRLSPPALHEPPLPRWTASAGAGLFYAGRSQWAQAVGELELRAQPRDGLSVSLGAFVGGGRGTLERATVRSRFVTLQLLVSGHVHTRRASLEVGAGYLGALSFFAGTSLADPSLAGVRAVVPWGGPVVRVEASWRSGAFRVPVRVYAGWTLPQTRLFVGGVAVVDWSGPFAVITGGIL